MSLSKEQVKKIIGNYLNNPQELISILLDIQAASGANCVEKEWALLVAEILDVPLSKVYDVLTFYAMFSTEPRGEFVIEICQSTPCFFGGSCNCKTTDVVRWFESACGIKMGETTVDGKITLLFTSCVGACGMGPVVKIGDEVYGNLNEEQVNALVKSLYEANLGIMGQRSGGSDIDSKSNLDTNKSLDNYIKQDGFAALVKAVKITPEQTIAEIKKAKLLGRGGAAYPAGNKWEHLLHIEETPKYIVCNADEGEPGTFKDKFIMEEQPYKLLEGIMIAGVVFKAKAAYIYVRGEYRNIQKKLLKAIEKVRAAGYLSDDYLGGHYFDIKVISGAGAYVCGENSALLNSTEGKVGRPRIKPPHLAEVGLFLQPTLVNNVESFANIPVILNMGGDAYLQAGHPDSGGSKLVCLSGHVKNRGVFDIPLGKLSLRDIIYDDNFGGGLAGDKPLKFFHLGGQSGPIGSAAQLDTVYSYTDLKNARLSVGSGAIVVMDESVSILEYLIGVTEFFIHESCGKCVPCREGNRQVLAILKKLAAPADSAGAATQEDLETLKQLIHTMTSASFCGLGQTTCAALSSAWKLFKTEFEANVEYCKTTGGAK